MQTLLQDIRFAIRRFRKDPAFMAVTIVTLALGIGATSAIFSVVNGVLLRPLPFAHSDHVVLLMEQIKRFPRFSVSYQNFVDWRGQAQSYESVAAVRNTVVTLSGSAEPERLPAQMATANLFNRLVSPNYFAALHVPLQQGRFFQDTDREDHPMVVIVNNTFARTFFPNQSPVGQIMQIGGLPDNEVPWMEIVGVVGDVKQTLSNDAPAEFYIPYRQSDKLFPVQFMSLILRTESSPQSLANSVQRVVHQIDPNQPVAKIRTMEDNIADSISEPRFRTVLLTLFAGIALALAGIGIFSVMAYTVTQRTREIGVRVALGASRSQIFQLTLGYTLRLTAIGTVIGMAAAFVLTRYVSAFLFQVPTYDLFALGGSAIVIVLVAIAASYLPARRATGIDPAKVLRQN